MSADSGPGGALSVLEHLRRLHLRRATGLLHCESHDRSRDFFFRDGDLWFPAAHTLARRIVEIRELPSEGARRQKWWELLDLLLPVLEGGRARSATFTEGEGALPGTLEGPVPTAALLRRAWHLQGAGTSDEPRLRADQKLLLAAAEAQPDALGWSPEELWILERLRQPMTPVELERQSPIPLTALRAALRGLLALEVVAFAGGRASHAVPAGVQELSRRLRLRIAESLSEEPLELSPAEARRRIVDLLSTAGGQNHYELLEVCPGADAATVQAAFERLARLVHPEKSEPLAPEGQREALDFLFDRATEAYHVLSDPTLRLAYDTAQGIDPQATSPDEAERRDEVTRVARALFRQAQMEERVGEVHTAVQLLEQAAQADPRAEYFAALGRLQARNPAWLTRALESFRRALELDHDSGSIRYSYGLLLERAGDLAQARRAYQSAAAAAVPHPEAHAALARVSTVLGAPDGSASGTHKLGRLFRRE
jgi:curved DNA-binding protein CbpA